MVQQSNVVKEKFREHRWARYEHRFQALAESALDLIKKKARRESEINDLIQALQNFKDGKKAAYYAEDFPKGDEND